jgi:hypothetical protein
MANALENLSNVELVALNKLVSTAVAKRAVTELPVGVTTLKSTIDIEGEVKRGEDYDQQVVQAAKPWLIIVKLMSKLNGVTIESVVEEVLSDEGIESPASVKALEKRAADAAKRIKASTTRRCNGKVTTKLTATSV